MKNMLVAAVCLVLGVSVAWGQAPRAGGVRLGQFTWQSSNQTDDLRLENGLMKATSMGFDPYMEAQANLDAAAVKTLSIKMAITGGSDGQVYWAPWSEPRSIMFTLIPDGRMHTYIVPVATVPTSPAGAAWMALAASNAASPLAPTATLRLPKNSRSCSTARLTRF